MPGWRVLSGVRGRIRIACLLFTAGCGASAAAPPPTASVRVGRFPVDLAIGDLDGDGRLDLVSADARDRRISTRLAREGGYRAGHGAGLPIEPHMVVLAHIDRDRHLDVIATGHDDPGVHVLFGDGTGRFRAARGSPFAAHPGARGHNHGLVTGDLDGDGDADLATSNQDQGSVSVLLGDGAGRFAAAPGSPIAVGREPYPLALADLDASGSLDLVVPLVGGDRVAVLLNDGAARFSSAPGSPLATLARPYSVAVADLDGDRALDVVVSHDDTDTITILRGDGTGRLRERTRLPAGQRPWRFAAADLDGDGDIDLAGGAGDRVLLLAGDGKGGLAPGRPLLRTRQAWTAVVADLDGDGRPDVAAPDALAGAIRIRAGR